MKNKKDNEDVIDAATEAVLKYWRFSKLLFAETSETPYRMNELKPTNEFYGMAKDMADELEIDWEKMNDAESNRIMLNMLSDLYAEIGTATDRKCKLNISVTIINQPKGEKKKDGNA